MKLITPFVLLCFLSVISRAQTGPISIGQHCPDLQFKMINFRRPSVSIGDYKGKILILDLWATWCQPCRAFLSTAKKLNTQFAGRVEILPVTYEDAKQATDFLADYQKATGYRIESAVEDTMVDHLFPHGYIPHEIWLDPQGKVIGITDEKAVTPENLQKVINDPSAGLPHTEDSIRYANFDFQKPVLTGDDGFVVPRDSILFEDRNDKYDLVITKHLDAFSYGQYYNNKSGLTFINGPLTHLLNYAASAMSPDFIGYTRVIVDVKDTTVLKGPKYPRQAMLEWMKKNTYCLELNVKDTSLEKDKFTLALNALNKVSQRIGIKTGLETRTESCYVLTRTSDQDKLKSEARTTTGSFNQYAIDVQGYFIPEFVSRMRYFLQSLNMPLIDETRMIEPVDMQFDCNMNNIDAVNAALVKYDLKFVKTTRPMTMVVISNSK